MTNAGLRVTGSAWGRRTFGDPCHGCGHHWSLTTAASIDLVRSIPDRFAQVLAGCSGFERHPDLTWSTGDYLGHVVDNLRIWTDRLEASAASNGDADRTAIPIEPYDAEQLVGARRQERLPLDELLAQLQVVSERWAVAAEAETGAALGREMRFAHPDRGEISVDDIVSTNAHDAAHHHWDLTRIVAASAHRS